MLRTKKTPESLSVLKNIRFILVLNVDIIMESNEVPANSPWLGKTSDFLNSLIKTGKVYKWLCNSVPFRSHC